MRQVDEVKQMNLERQEPTRKHSGRNDQVGVPRKDIDHEKSVDEILEAAGFNDIDKRTSHSAIETALKNLAKEIKGLGKLRLLMVREAVLKCLVGTDLKSPTQLVDAALELGAKGTAEKDVQGKSIVLAEPEPWSDIVDGAELLKDIVAVFQRYVILPDSAALALALWIVHTQALEAAQISPILAITCPVMRCAKTLILEVLEQIVSRPLPTSNITPATLFRTVEKYRPTLLIDEADSFLCYNDELRGVLNSGHRRSAAVVIRTVGDSYEPRIFSTWCPKAIVLIEKSPGNLPETLQDRAIIIRQKRKAPGEQVERWRRDRIPPDIKTLRRKAVRWVTDHLDELRDADPAVPEGLNDRQADNWRPLLAIADAAKGQWPDWARETALLFCGQKKGEESQRVQLLEDLRELFADADELPSAKIVGDLAKREDRPWPEYRNGKPITVRQMALLLKPFDILPRQLWIDGRNVKGYQRTSFEDAWARYTPNDPIEPIEPSGGKGLGVVPDPIGQSIPIGSKNVRNPHEQGVLSVLSDQKGKKGAYGGPEAPEGESYKGDL